MLGDEMVAAAHQVIRHQAAREIRIEDGNGNGIHRGGQRFIDAFRGVAPVPIAGNLRNLEDPQLDRRMLAYRTSLYVVCLGVVMPASGKMLRANT